MTEKIYTPEHSYNSFMVKTNGIRLHTIQAGPADGPLVILLHGFPEFWYAWKHQVPPLVEAGYRVWVPDQRGYNLSDKPDGIGAYHIDTLALDIVGLIDAAGEQQAYIVGHDWGAAVAWHLVSNYPERVNKLVNMNVPHFGVMMKAQQSSMKQFLKSWYTYFFQIPWLPEQLLGSRGSGGLVRMMKNSGKPGFFPPETQEIYRQAWEQPGALTAMINWYRSAMPYGLKNRANLLPETKIKVPTILIWGVNDVALSREMAQPSIDLCEDGRLVFVEDATHWVQHDEPDHVNQLMLDFLRDQ